jgi:uncharacterized low-complexity protein
MVVVLAAATVGGAAIANDPNAISAQIGHNVGSASDSASGDKWVCDEERTGANSECRQRDCCGRGSCIRRS